MRKDFIIALLLVTAFEYGLPNPLKVALKSGKFDYEIIDVDVTEDVTYYGSSRTPTSYHVKAKAFGENLDLHVKRLHSIFHENYRMFSLELDSNNEPTFKLVKLQIHDQPVYQDDNKTCVLHLSYEDGHLQMEGTLSTELSIVPAHSVGLRGKSGGHVVIKNNPGQAPSGRDYYGITSSINGVPPKDHDSALPKIVNPELLAIVDYKNARNLEFDDGEMQKYLAIFWNSVNTRYALVPDPKMELLLIGSIVTKDPKLQQYLEDSRLVVDSKDAVNLHIALPALQKFLYQHKEAIPSFDIAMLMTAEDMAGRVDVDLMDASIAGAALVGAACQEGSEEDPMVRSAGMAEDDGPFYTGVLNHAHEIAHLLGSVHDGDAPYKGLPGHPGAEACPWTQGYLMSYRFGSKEHLRWSNCTIEQFRFFLGLDQASCLLSVQAPQPVKLNTTLPGQLMDLDDQCRALMGPTSKYFRDQNLVYVCTALYCHVDNKIVARGPAYEGSPCGYEGPTRWCRDGTCRIKPVGF